MAEKQYIIGQMSRNSGQILWWNKDLGWKDTREEATRFSKEDKDLMTLPDGTADYFRPGWLEVKN